MTFPPAEIHYSQLRAMRMSPAHFRAACETPWQPSAAMRMGTLVHAIVLGGHFVVWDGKRDNSKAWTAFKAEHEGETIVTRAEYDRAMECAQVVLAHPLAGPRLRGHREVDLTWQVLNRDCAGRLDVIGPGFITEVKTTACAAPGWFRFHAMKMGYHAQLSWYREGARQRGHAIDVAFIVAIETKPPYAVSVMQLTERALEEGERMWRVWMERLLACESAGEWPEYSQCVVELDVPEDVDLVFPEDAEEEEAA